MSPLLSAILAPFREVWLVDAEYCSLPGEPVRGICHAAREIRGGARISRWTWGRDAGSCPWDPDDPSVVILCFSAVAECSYFLSCGWRSPRSIVDLWIARRLTSNGLIAPFRHGLLHTLDDLGIPHSVDTAEKRMWRRLCADGGPFSDEDRIKILRYCESDIAPLEELAEKLLPHVDLVQLMEFGRYSAHVASVERRGLPVDAPRHRLIADRFSEMQSAAAVRANVRMRFDVFGGPSRRITSFSPAAAEELVHSRLGISDNWPTTKTGRLMFDRKTLKNMEGRHEDVAHIKRGRAMTTMRHPRGIHVGSDGRCRSAILPFMAITSRNTNKANSPLYYPGPMRALIVPRRPHALVIVDIDQADSGVAAGVSGDEAMRRDYFSPLGDFYLAFGVRSHLLPQSPSFKNSNVVLARKRLKVAVNAIMYGSQAANLSQILGEPIDVSRATMRKHRTYYETYWEAAEGWTTAAAVNGFHELPSGWRGYRLPFTTALNFPIQGVGADILRAASLEVETMGIPIVFTQHDSLAGEVSEGDVTDAADAIKAAIGNASERIIGLRLRASHQIIKAGKRYFKDDESREWWFEISKALGVDP